MKVWRLLLIMGFALVSGESVQAGGPGGNSQTWKISAEDIKTVIKYDQLGGSTHYMATLNNGDLLEIGMWLDAQQAIKTTKGTYIYPNGLSFPIDTRCVIAVKKALKEIYKKTPTP